MTDTLTVRPFADVGEDAERFYLGDIPCSGWVLHFEHVVGTDEVTFSSEQAL